MESQPNLRDALLAHVEPDADRLARYRVEVQKVLEQQEKTLRMQKWYAGGIWIFVVLLTTAFLLLGGYRNDGPVGFWPIMMAIFMTIYAAVELLKYFLNISRVELLKEIKGLELLVRELQEQIRKGGSASV